MRNTRLEAEGAEFLVLGELLIRGIPAYKTYTNMAGYDLIATWPDSHRSARVQVKSRFHTGASGCYVSNLDTDFLVMAFLNRGRTYNPDDIQQPEYYVLPIRVVKRYQNNGSRPKLYLRDISRVEKYRDNWDLIREFLRKTGKS